MFEYTWQCLVSTITLEYSAGICGGGGWCSSPGWQSARLWQNGQQNETSEKKKKILYAMNIQLLTQIRGNSVNN